MMCFRAAYSGSGVSIVLSPIMCFDFGAVKI